MQFVLCKHKKALCLRRVLGARSGQCTSPCGRASPVRFSDGARFGLKYEQAFWQRRLKLFHNSDVLLSLESLADYLYQSRTGVRVPMGNGLSLGTQVNVDYDAVPAAGKETTDTALIFNLDYAL